MKLAKTINWGDEATGSNAGPPQWARLVRTIAPLRWSQPTWRLWRIAEARAARWSAVIGSSTRQTAMPARAATLPMALGAKPPLESVSSDSTGAVAGFGELQASWIAAMAQGRFEHLSRERQLGFTRPDWLLGPQSSDRLWAVTLHYHDWAWRLARAACQQGDAAWRAAELFEHYLRDWIEHCDVARPGTRDLAWNPYAVATRIGNWSRAVMVAGPTLFAGRQEFQRLVFDSLARQARFLAGHLEWDLRGNHLIRDAVGLAWAGRTFRGAAARRWLRAAAELGVAQAEEQILADGGHFERSPMYHLEVIQDLEWLVKLLPPSPLIQRIAVRLNSMRDFAHWLCHPDGLTAQFNDGERRGLPGHQADWGTRPSGGRYFRETGMVVWHGPRWSVFFDVGPVGPGVQPGHGHADTLSVEASYGGRRLLVDPGTYSYDHDPRRAYDRSTSSHNTLHVDGVDSSEVWHVFRVGRRARVRQAEVSLRRDGLSAGAVHDGYCHLPGRPRHARSVMIDPDGRFWIRDRVSGSQSHRVSAGLLIEPSWECRPADGGWLLSNGPLAVRVQVISRRPIRLVCRQRPFHPYYHVEQTAGRLEWHYEGPLPIDVTILVTGV